MLNSLTTQAPGASKRETKHNAHDILRCCCQTTAFDLSGSFRVSHRFRVAPLILPRCTVLGTASLGAEWGLRVPHTSTHCLAPRGLLAKKAEPHVPPPLPSKASLPLPSTPISSQPGWLRGPNSLQPCATPAARSAPPRAGPISLSSLGPSGLSRALSLTALLATPFAASSVPNIALDLLAFEHFKHMCLHSLLRLQAKRLSRPHDMALSPEMQRVAVASEIVFHLASTSDRVTAQFLAQACLSFA